MFRQTLDVKSDYEQVIADLVQNASTEQETLRIINRVMDQKPKKEKNVQMMRKHSQISQFTKFNTPRGSVRSPNTKESSYSKRFSSNFVITDLTIKRMNASSSQRKARCSDTATFYQD